MDSLPEWLLTPLVAAIIAAVGYVSKLAIEEVAQWRSIRRERRSKLVELQSLLLATREIYQIQNELIQRLCDEIEPTRPGIKRQSYDEILAAGYVRMNEQQRLAHGLIRAYTTNAMRPLNLAMIDWLAKDTYFKGKTGSGSADDLATNLQTLEAHLLLWRAKYDFWIPERPERAIVYLADEHTHGVGFPRGIERVIARATGGTLKQARRHQKDKGRPSNFEENQLHALSEKSVGVENSGEPSPEQPREMSSHEYAEKLPPEERSERV
jgi:hypothetical protein